MRIEENYRDVIIYSVIFKSKTTNKEINRMLVLNSRDTDLEKSTLEHIVLNTFNHVSEVVHIEEHLDGLLLKEDSPYYVSAKIDGKE
ncbi:conserved hypothetical protein [Carnobacterium maltaromaticum]|nr:hypothetical protein [Carnobacterium maltaromaticum]MDZ5760821.1 hypothetical protein [Carnobacterium maltaromaticum]CAD5899380.1 conserved hypothetical protein [Carnobacterium maltaromaticum]